MQRRTFLGADGGATLLGGGAVAYELFAPEQATEANEDRTGRTDDGDGVTRMATESSNGESSTAGWSTSEGTSGDSGGDGGDGGDGGGATERKTGEFTGKDGHECSGSVAVGRFTRLTVVEPLRPDAITHHTI